MAEMGYVEYVEHTCPNCNGRGAVRSLLIFRRECPTCEGWGVVRIAQYRPVSYPAPASPKSRRRGKQVPAPRFTVTDPQRQNQYGAAYMQQQRQWQQGFQQQQQRNLQWSQQQNRQAAQQHQKFVNQVNKHHRGW